MTHEVEVTEQGIHEITHQETEAYARVKAWCLARTAQGDPDRAGVTVGLTALDALSLSLSVATAQSALAPASTPLQDSIGTVAPSPSATPRTSPRPQDGGVRSVDSGDLHHSQLSLVHGSDETIHPAAGKPGSTRSSDDASHPALPDRYEIMYAARGGMGIAYVGFDHVTDRPFVIKTFREDLFVGREKTLPAFVREVELWTKLCPHPNLVEAYGARLIGGVPYLFMEWVEGGTVRELLDQKGHLDAADAAEAGVQIVSALLHARRRVSGFTHLDLKPRNVLLQDGVLKVTDLGLARGAVWFAGDRGRRREASAGGTPAYMAPEQWRGDRVSERTDVYALGALLYELISGARPFAATSVKGYRDAHLQQPVPPLAPLAGALPSDLAGLIERCLSKRAKKRPSLRKLLQGLAAHARARSGDPKALFQRPGSMAYLFSRRPFSWMLRASLLRRVDAMLGFGQEFAGGIGEAVRRQLAIVEATRPLTEEALARWIALSRLRKE
ncbi:MAG: serine/threonine-protein kinase, partial [Planctomycetota bacterium]